jgi:anaerobic ribonucleoside-triphosphate reductase activating protein
MKYSSVQLTFQEVPEEISLCFLITGCQLKCPGCHSADAWDARQGVELSASHFLELLDKYQSAITCVCFLGGEWQEEELKILCRTAQERGLLTCLYTGLDDVSESLKSVLDFLKTGRFIMEKGGLSSSTTNQKFIDLRTNQCLNHYFTAQGGLYGQTE